MGSAARDPPLSIQLAIVARNVVVPVIDPVAPASPTSFRAAVSSGSRSLRACCGMAVDDPTEKLHKRVDM